MSDDALAYVQTPDLHAYLEQLNSEVLLVADCRGTTERDLLSHWIQSALGSVGQTAADSACFLNLSKPSSVDTKELQTKLKTLAANTLILPVRVLWHPPQGKKRLRDLLLGNPYQPNSFAQYLILRMQSDRCSLVFGEPASVSALQTKQQSESPDSSLPAYVVRQAVLELKQVERNLLGRQYKQPAFVETVILEDEAFKDDLQTIASKTNTDTTALREEAKVYIKELIPSSTPLGLDLLVKLSRFVYTRGYDEDIVFDAMQVERVRELAGKHPVVLLCNHRSQVDSFSMYAGLYDQDIPHPHTFGGINMKMPVIGQIMRSSGMVFIRRAFSDNAVYKVVLQRYIDYLVRKRFPLLWSIEGGRSRTGKLIPPRYGLLRWLMKAAERYDASTPLYIVPMAIVFEQVADVGAYRHEQQGGIKKPEDLKWFFNYLSSFKTNLGKIHIRFGEPVKAYVDAGQANDHLAVERLAFETCVQLNHATPVTKASLICMVLLAAAPQALKKAQMIADLEKLLAYLRHYSAQAVFSLDISATDLIDTGVEPLIKNGVVQLFEGGLEPVFSIAQDHELDAAYYRNNAIHFFYISAIADIALARLYMEGVASEAEQALEDEVLRLKRLLQWEFFFPTTEVFLQQLYADLDYRSPAWRERMREGKQGLRALFLEIDPLLGHSALEPYLEAYHVVAEQLAAMPADVTFERKDFLSKCQATGKQLLLQRQIVSSESIAKAMFENGLKVASALELLETTEEAGDKRRDFAHKLSDIMRWTRALRSLAAARRAGLLDLSGMPEKQPLRS
ncbi:MAG: 1-acyl-sn-glycerol-3-phosphate acyltransferase [Pseudomonadales bacterium]